MTVGPLVHDVPSWWSSILPPSAGPGVSGLCLGHHQFQLHHCCSRAMSEIQRPGLVLDGFRAHRDAKAGQRDDQCLGSGRPMSSSRLASRSVLTYRTTGGSQRRPQPARQRELRSLVGRPGADEADRRYTWTSALSVVGYPLSYASSSRPVSPSTPFYPRSSPGSTFYHHLSNMPRLACTVMAQSQLRPPGTRPHTRIVGTT